jgi:cytochrome c553
MIQYGVPALRRMVKALMLIAIASSALTATGSELAEGKKLFDQMCASCHGPTAQGSESLHAPPLAGQYADYVIRQVTHFKSGLRAGEPGTPANLMQTIASGIPDIQVVKPIAAYLEKLKPISTKARAPQPVQVRGVFGICVGCHNAQAEGIQSMGSARLNMLPEWYLVSQMQAFKNGTRGTHAQDTYGKQMVTIMADLPDEEIIRDLATYIQYLDKKAVSKK